MTTFSQGMKGNVVANPNVVMPKEYVTFFSLFLL